MKNLFADTRLLDAACRERYLLTEEVMMENAAAGLERELRSRLGAAFGGRERRRVLVLCGGGNNGADGYALSRRLSRSADVAVAVCMPPKSPLCTVQASRARAAGVPLVPLPADVAGAAAVVDCVFGSGFHGELDESVAALFERVNALPAGCLRIACDVPTGLREDGTVAEGAFRADVTVTMGALKLSLYSDAAKDIAGDIVTAELGVSRALFEQAGAEESGGTALAPAAQLLEERDLALPERRRSNVHKGSFGHAVVASGEKGGAACIAGTAALRFGAGLVTLVRLAEDGAAPATTNPELMTAAELPEAVRAVALGMGLGRGGSAAEPWFSYLRTHGGIPCVIDADACYAPSLPALLRERAGGIVLTPHPKEFQALLAHCGLGDHSVADCVNRRPALIAAFCRAYPAAVLLVKGANPMIGACDGIRQRLFVNPLGTAALAKAGSGDVLAGLVVALLAQGRSPLDAACTASLAHALASRAFKHSYALSPLALIEAVATL